MNDVSYIDVSICLVSSILQIANEAGLLTIAVDLGELYIVCFRLVLHPRARSTSSSQKLLARGPAAFLVLIDIEKEGLLSDNIDSKRILPKVMRQPANDTGTALHPRRNLAAA